MQKSLMFVLCASFGIAAVGCGNSVKDAANGAAGIFDGRASELQYRFQDETCREPLALQVIGASRRTSFEFAGRDVIRNEQYFSEPDCKGDVAIDVSYRGSYTVGDETAENVRPIDLSYGQATVVPRSQAGADALNSFNLCGIADWTVGRQNDVTSVSRDAQCPVAATPLAVYDTYLENDGVLVFGKGEDQDKSSAQSRPTELNREVSYRRVN